MPRKKKAKPFDPAASERLRAEREAFANMPDPRTDEGPSARLLRQMIRLSKAPTPPAQEPDFVWSESQLKRMTRAENQVQSADRKEVARGRAEMASLARERDAHLAKLERQRATAETLELAAGRGEDLDVAEGKGDDTVRPIRRRSGLEWLRHKRRLTDEQYLSGQRYADDYRVSSENPLKSCLAETRGNADDLNGLEAREEAFIRLRAARAGALSDHIGMVAICDQVCGEGRTIRQLSGDSDTEAQQNETTLRIALDLLSEHYGIKNLENRLRVSHWA